MAHPVDNSSEQKYDDEDEDEGFDEYEQNAMKRIRENQSNDNSAKTRNLLPVRSENGWEKRTCDVKDDDYLQGNN